MPRIVYVFCLNRNKTNFLSFSESISVAFLTNQPLIMKNLLLIIAATTMLASCADTTDSVAVKNPVMKLTYPETKTVDTTDTYFGTTVKDEYRWLEDDNADDTKAWVKAQNEVTFGYLENIPYRDAIRDRYEDIFNYPKVGAPFKAGEYYFFNKNSGLQNQSVIYIQKGLDGKPEVFLDPNAINAEGTTSINLVGISKDNKYVAYARSDGGSDWQKMYVMEIATKKQLDDELNWVKFSGASWHKDGFFYSRYPAPAAGEELKGNNQFHSVYYHKLGDDQSKDKLVYRDDNSPNIYHFGSVTEDEKYFVLYKQPGTDGFATYIKDLEKDGPFVELFDGYTNKTSAVKHLGAGKMLFKTNIDAPNYRLVAVDLNNPAKENWTEVIPETDNLLGSISSGGGKLFADYLEKATTRIYQMDYDGSNKKAIDLPGLGSAGGFSGKDEDKILFYSFTSFTYPVSIFKYDVETGKSEQFFKTELKFKPEDYVEKQVTYTSKDGTPVTMFIVHKKGLKMDGQNPTYLYAYGGFNVNLSPSFSTSRVILLENGGVFAMPNLRGGGEYGEKWHEGGMLLNKQNVFDDFFAAADYLKKEGYTSTEKLSVSGGSNGGLLVGATIAQRPDIAAVAYPAVGVMDMLRYHKFTVGKGWIPEYGSSEASEADFKNLHGYSPLHNLKEGTQYPATMVTTADHDDRVVPAHSFKFAARLQKAHEGDNPVLIRVAVDAGHGAGKPVSMTLDEEADRWAFLFWNTNSPVNY